MPGPRSHGLVREPPRRYGGMIETEKKQPCFSSELACENHA